MDIGDAVIGDLDTGFVPEVPEIPSLGLGDQRGKFLAGKVLRTAEQPRALVV